jgi:anti-sigma B factor antagonist
VAGLTVSVAQPADGVPVVVVAGDLDMATAGDMSQQLAEVVGAGTDVVVDLSGLEFIDSTGLNALIAARRASEGRGGTLTLRRPARCVRRVLGITGLDQVFAIEG